MRFSRAFIPTMREDPSDADTASNRLLLRGGFIRKVASGIYEWLPLGVRVLKKVESIVREEMNAAGGQETILPVVQPKELWEESGRWVKYGRELLRFKDRKEAEFCLSATAEEVMTTLVAHHARSWRSLPLMLYQIGIKFRDEIRPRFGLLRGREFLMKDAYSFHADEADAERYYEVMRFSYCRIFDRLGLNYRPVEADSGAIGGSFSHEFMVLAETGEDVIAYCDSCAYAANLERAECRPINDVQSPKPKAQSPEDVATPGKYSVDDVSAMLDLPKERFIKTLFYMADGKIPVVCLVRGDHELNEVKLRRVLGSDQLRKMEKGEYERLCGAPVGFAGPQGLAAHAKAVDSMALIIADHAVAAIADGVSGANKKDFHILHLSYGRDFNADRVADLRQALAGDACPRCGKGKIEFLRGIEVGHVFKLGTKYSEPLKAQYLDRQGKSHLMVMGTYGIGVSRIVAAAVEQNNDKQGILWPKSMAPYEVVVLNLDPEDDQVTEAAEGVYQELKGRGIDAALDDRDESAGVKFKDADLMGIPLTARMGSRSLASGQVEIKPRNGQVAKVPLGETMGKVCSLLDNYKPQ
ncbi:MAG: proline--tRNA ligase [Elusimicrobia bacterium]|nr:proline--tRNA ligase [Elusimicrobiota bacterium]